MAATMLLVLAALGGQTACGVQANQPTGAAVQAHSDHGHPRGGGETPAVHGMATVHLAETATRSLTRSLADRSSGCADHDTGTAQADPLPPSPVPATAPEHAAARLALTGARHDHRTASSVALAAAPSLHALGISRT